MREWVEREKERLMESRGKTGRQNSRIGEKSAAITYGRHEEGSQKDTCVKERQEGRERFFKMVFYQSSCS